MALHTLDQIRSDDPSGLQNKSEDPDPLELLATIAKILKKKQRFILACSLGSAVLAGFVAFMIPPTFTGVASFVPPASSSNSSAAALIGQLSSMGGGSSLLGGGKTTGDLYVGILKSHTVSRQLVKTFNLTSVYKVRKESDAEKQLAAHTDFAIGTKDTIVTVSATDRDPARARDLANAYLDALRTTSGGLALTENSQRRQFYEQRLALEKDQLADAEVALKQSQEKSGLIAPVGQTSIGLTAIAQLRSQIATSEVRLASLRIGESDESIDVRRLKEELASLRAQVNQMENGKGKNAGGPSTAEVPALTLEYIRRARDVKYHETLFEILSKQYETARLDEAHDPTLQILDRAILPDTKSGPHRLLIIGVGFLVGLLLSVAWSLLRSVAGRSKTPVAVPL
jgi:tyrosine-protein kinase Etk/Wzc